MPFSQGHSLLADPPAAVEEATRSFGPSPEILFVFSSTSQEPSTLHEALVARFPGTPIAGCTTAGEQVGNLHLNGGLVIMAAYDTGVRWAVDVLHGLERQDEASTQRAVDALVDKAGIQRDELEPEQAVALLFVDGLRGQEERLSELLADALENVPLAGGSAGDDLKFEETRVLSQDGAFTDAAVLVVAHSLTAGPIKILKHQHFKRTKSPLVVTSAEGRTVHEFDGMRALDAYAAALGMDPGEVDNGVCFQNPVTFACNGELYVRSIQSIHEDGSLQFYCAVEEGMVVDLGGHHDMRETLAKDMEEAFPDGAEMVVGFNCILRALEATAQDLHSDLGSILGRSAEHLIGFDTYGEQLNGLHINQTLLAVGFGTGGREVKA